MAFQSISVIGLGYIGLPTAAVLASKKKNVFGIDVNLETINIINSGSIHIVEPGLEKVVKNGVEAGYLKAYLEPQPADAFIIAVPTPFKRNNLEIPEPDLSYVKAAAHSISSVLKKGDLVVLESTSPVGTTLKISEWLAELRPDLSFPHNALSQADINIAYCPERVLPGNIIEELVSNDRIIGGISDLCSNRAVELYKCFVDGSCIITNSRTAEMSKLTENTARDIQIAFANELSVICDNLDINVWELINLANKHPRVNILQPGPGVGGHCIAVDPWFIVSEDKKNSKLIKAARNVNDDKVNWVIEKVKKKVNELIINGEFAKESDIVIGCFGQTFKPNIDDIRESPAFKISSELKRQLECEVLFIEPHLKYINEIQVTSIEDGLERSNINLILVKHDAFQNVCFTGNTIDVVGINDN